MVRKTLFLAFFGLLTFSVKAQDIKYPLLDTSPVDIVYYPLNAAKVKSDDLIKPVIKIIYSRPQKKGREVFGVLEQFGKVWRLGANESTEVKLYKNVTIGDKKIKAGTYSLFAIPNKDNWTIIVNQQLDRWGVFSYDETKDVVRVNVPVKTMEKPLEALTLTFVDTTEGANLVIAWDKTQAQLPIAFNK